MKLIEQKIPGLFLVEHDIFSDKRGVFRRSFCRTTLQKVGITFEAVQGNISENPNKHTLRGFHYQLPPHSEGKLLTCITGSIWNVVVDLREDSSSYLTHQSMQISSKDRRSILVPPGCANAFLTMEDGTMIHYYMGAEFDANSYAGFRYDDPYFAIDWPANPAVVSDRDLAYELFDVK